MTFSSYNFRVPGIYVDEMNISVPALKVERPRLIALYLCSDTDIVGQALSWTFRQGGAAMNRSLSGGFTEYVTRGDSQIDFEQFVLCDGVAFNPADSINLFLIQVDQSRSLARFCRIFKGQFLRIEQHNILVRGEVQRGMTGSILLPQGSIGPFFEQSFNTIVRTVDDELMARLIDMESRGGLPSFQSNLRSQQQDLNRAIDWEQQYSANPPEDRLSSLGVAAYVPVLDKPVIVEKKKILTRKIDFGK